MIIAENVLNLGKEAITQVQEAERVPYRMNSKRNAPRHIIIEISKVKERILKTTKGKAIYYIQKKPHKSISRFLRRKFAGQKREA